MKTRVAMSLAVVATASLVVPSQAPAVVPVGSPDPSVETLLAGVDPGETVPVLVTLRSQVASPATLAGDGSAKTRHESLVRGLRSGAESGQRSVRADLDRLARKGKVRSQKPLWVTNAVAVTATPDAVREIAARPDVASVVSDRVNVTPTALPPEPNIDTTHAPQLWAAGRTGTGVVVASLDSGVDTTNPDLAASWRGGSNSWFDPYGQHATMPVDLLGHGTSVMGTMVGATDAGSPYGMAPGGRWISARIYDDAGSSTLSAIHQSFQWLLDPDHDPATDDAPDVVNLSWVLGTGPGCDLSVQPDIAALRAAGILPVAAAGNFGPSAGGTSASPGNYPEVLSVGAVTLTNALASFSSTGPSTCAGRARVFPDLVAPGKSVLVADKGGTYAYSDGTSIASPHVAGAAALLMQGRPTLTPDAVVDALTGTAHDLGATGQDTTFGNGLVDVAAADAALGQVATPVGDFRLRLDSGRLAAAPSRTTRTRLRVQPLGGFTASTTLILEGLAPSEGSWWFAPEQVAPGHWESVLRIKTLPGIATGQHRLTVRATGGGRDHTVALNLFVLRREHAVLLHRGHAVLR